MFQNKKKVAIAFLLGRLMYMPLSLHAQEELAPAPQVIPDENWNANFQSTYLWQHKDAFSAPYSGDNSLMPGREKSYSLTATAYFGYRPWHGTELYFNPEMIQAVPFSELHGLGGLTNSEQQKTSGPTPTFYRARLYLKQTFDFGGGQDAVESGANQLAGMVDRHRLVITVGNMSIIDIFDNNSYAHDPRTQFTNWALLTHGAFDYAADARGYTWGAAAEYYDGDWAFRAGRYLVPVIANGQPLDTRYGRLHGDQVEIERDYSLGSQSGKLKLMAFRNHEIMGNFDDAIAAASLSGGIPSVVDVRREQNKVGYGLSLEHALRPDVGLFARASWNDGQTETYSFTEIERSVSAGLSFNGNRWHRPRDTFALAFAQNGLSQAHRDYLALGGLGGFIGDGRLNYKPEQITEVYYNLNLTGATSLMLGYQHINNPGYNTDRGPVNVDTVRLHAEF